MFHRMDEIEKAGSGIRRILSATSAAGLSKPRFDLSTFFTITFWRPDSVAKAHDGAHDGAHLPLTRFGKDILELCFVPKSTPELLVALGLKAKSGFYKRTIDILLRNGLLGYRFPDKPRSKRQKYLTTDNGRRSLGRNIEAHDQAHDGAHD